MPRSAKEEISALAVDVHHLQKDIIEIKQDVKRLNKQANMGLGAFKFLLWLGAVVSTIIGISISIYHSIWRS